MDSFEKQLSVRERRLQPFLGVAATLAGIAGLFYWFKRAQQEKVHARLEGNDGPTQEAIAPGPPGLPIVGNFALFGQDVPAGLQRLRRQYGDIVRLRIGPRVSHLISDPALVQYVLQDNNRNYIKGRGLQKSQDLLGQGLLTSEGEFWRRQRRLIQPAFHRQHIGAFARTMTNATALMLDRWEETAEQGASLDVYGEMMRLTLDIVSKTLFHTTLNPADLETVSRVMTPLLQHATERISRPFDLTETWPTPANRRQMARVKQLDEIVYGIIERRRAQKASVPAAVHPEQPDLLGMLMAAQDEETGLGMSDKQLRDEVMTIFLAGHETTAILLAFTWYLLSQHVSVREKVQAEVDEVLEGRTPTAVDAGRLAYTNMVLEEALRLYPPAWIISREALEDDEIGGYHIPAGSNVLIGIHLIHHHPALWENPEGFDPLRFTPQRKSERPRYAYLPFGGGPRLCIGNNFALMEAALVVAMVAQRYELNLVPGFSVKPEAAFTMRPNGPIPVDIVLRRA